MVVRRTELLAHFLLAAGDLALAARGVAGASRRDQPDVLAPLGREEGVAAVAALVVLRAVQGKGNGEGERVRLLKADLVPS